MQVRNTFVFKWVFYTAKPVIPRRLQVFLRRKLAAYERPRNSHIWPIDPTAGKPPENWPGWPGGKQFALVLSHDVDTVIGYNNVLKLAAIEEQLGFRSCFNFVPERYGKVSADLLDELRSRGFDVAVHGLKHDGKVFLSRRNFDRQARRINAYLEEWKTGGFTSPSMHHNLKWMTALNIEYSISTFDTDPFEPQPNGVGTIFPFPVYKNSADVCLSEPSSLPASLPRQPRSSARWYRGEISTEQRSEFNRGQPSSFFIELPYTLPQDSTLFVILQEKTIDIWKQKLDWIAEKGGMALLNTHPDYMDFENRGLNEMEYPVEHYTRFLEYISNRYAGEFYLALPEEMTKFAEKIFFRKMAGHKQIGSLFE